MHKVPCFFSQLLLSTKMVGGGGGGGRVTKTSIYSHVVQDNLCHVHTCILNLVSEKSNLRCPSLFVNFLSLDFV